MFRLCSWGVCVCVCVCLCVSPLFAEASKAKKQEGDDDEALISENPYTPRPKLHGR